ncbi:hypothetical protein F5880DRAFT_1619231, partial [Lentinula raphanica]
MSSGIVQTPTEPGTALTGVQSHPPGDILTHSSPAPIQGSRSTEDATDGWLECVVSEISMRLGNLYDCKTRLIFVNTPSPSRSFVFPDPEALIRVNTGDFALKTNKISNHRLLDAEARFSYLLQIIQALPLGQRLLGDVDVEEELLEALNKVHRVKERQWLSQAYPDGHDGSTVDTSIYFSQRYTTDATPALLAALIMYIRNRNSTRSMRVNLALLRCILRGFARKHGIQSEAPVLIPKDIHTIVNHFDLNPTLHVSVLCPQCYALYPFTEEALTAAENARQANAPLPVCKERSSPDSPLCGTTLWRISRSGNHPFLSPIRKQVFQDLKSWIGRILAIPSIENVIVDHQQRTSPPEAGFSRDFVDSVIFREFKGADGQPFSVPQTGPSGNPDLRL